MAEPISATTILLYLLMQLGSWTIRRLYLQLRGLPQDELISAMKKVLREWKKVRPEIENLIIRLENLETEFQRLLTYEAQLREEKHTASKNIDHHLEELKSILSEILKRVRSKKELEKLPQLLEEVVDVSCHARLARRLDVAYANLDEEQLEYKNFRYKNVYDVFHSRWYDRYVEKGTDFIVINRNQIPEGWVWKYPFRKYGYHPHYMESDSYRRAEAMPTVIESLSDPDAAEEFPYKKGLSVYVKLSPVSLVNENLSQKLYKILADPDIADLYFSVPKSPEEKLWHNLKTVFKAKQDKANLIKDFGLEFSDLQIFLDARKDEKDHAEEDEKFIQQRSTDLEIRKKQIRGKEKAVQDAIQTICKALATDTVSDHIRDTVDFQEHLGPGSAFPERSAIRLSACGHPIFEEYRNFLGPLNHGQTWVPKPVTEAASKLQYLAELAADHTVSAHASFASAQKSLQKNRSICDCVRFALMSMTRMDIMDMIDWERTVKDRRTFEDAIEVMACGTHCKLKEKIYEIEDEEKFKNASPDSITILMTYRKVTLGVSEQPIAPVDDGNFGDDLDKRLFGKYRRGKGSLEMLKNLLLGCKEARDNKVEALTAELRLTEEEKSQIIFRVKEIHRQNYNVHNQLRKIITSELEKESKVSVDLYTFGITKNPRQHTWESLSPLITLIEEKAKDFQSENIAFRVGRLEEKYRQSQ